MEDTRKLQLELSRFSSSLPAHLKLSNRNISRWVHSPERQVFVLLHGLYCITHIDLYRFSMPGIRERGTPDLLKKLPGNFILKSQKQAIAHAVTLARFWGTVQRNLEELGWQSDPARRLQHCGVHRKMRQSSHHGDAAQAVSRSELPQHCTALAKRARERGLHTASHYFLSPGLGALVPSHSVCEAQGE